LTFASRASIGGLFFSSELAGQLAGAPIAGALLTAAGGENFTPLICFSVRMSTRL
jgi:hypothetical protein